ncbi:MAG: bifunctional isocitrate dehydrogenase kinase/phosphatase [Gemmatimonadales bacterium]
MPGPGAEGADPKPPSRQPGLARPRPAPRYSRGTLRRAHPIDTNPAPRRTVELLLGALDRYRTEFRRLTRAVVGHFQSGDWPALDAATEDRLLLYPRSVTALVVELGRLSLEHPLPWPVIQRRFQSAIDGLADPEIAATFYNSAVRRLHGTVGVDPTHEFLDLAPPSLPARDGLRTLEVPSPEALPAAIDAAFESLGWRQWHDRAGDSARVAARLRTAVPWLSGGARLDWLPAAFVRRQRAFLVGNLATDAGTTPIMVGMVQRPEGISANAVVTGTDGASIVFGFTRSYFHVEVEEPRSAVGYLASLMPAKRLDELYSMIGYHRHGKREFYQALRRTLADPAARFEPVEGVPGLVMLAFALRPLNVVFKVIRDRSLPPKQVSRKEVMAKYEFVFRHEHGGRLADTQEYTGLSMPRAAFAPEVVEELDREARDTVATVADRLVFKHVYTERRMTPLDVYLREVSPESARAAVVDLGWAIKDLAGLNLFPGDLLPKNFGVTRHGRIVFYDYDEICTLTDCHFRTMPVATRYEDEVAAEPWFSVGPTDVFPEEWERFIRFAGPLHEAFRAHHADLFTADYWNRVRSRVATGGLVDPPPYRPEDEL